jgi:hypothetical protein
MYSSGPVFLSHSSKSTVQESLTLIKGVWPCEVTPSSDSATSSCALSGAKSYKDVAVTGLLLEVSSAHADSDNLKYYPGVYPEGLRKTVKLSVRIASL